MTHSYNYLQIFFSFYEFSWERESKIMLTFGYYFRIGRPEQFNTKTQCCLLHWCKEYLTAVKSKAQFLLLIKYWTFWYVEHSTAIKSSTLENMWRGRNNG